jgi:hypothetical protein
MAISTNGTVLTRLAGALYNTQMSNPTYEEVKALDPASLANALYTRDFSSVTDATVATTLVTNLGLTSVAGLANWVAAQLTAAGSAKGAKIVELLNGFAQMSADATYGAAATAFNTKVDASLALSQTVGNKGGTFAAAGVVVPTPVVNASFSLTVNADTLVGGAGDDTFTSVVSATAGVTTSTTGDVLTGGLGNDTLTLTIASTANPGLLQTAGIENVTFRALGDASIDMLLMEGVSTLTSNGGTNDITVTNGALATTYTVSNTIIGNGADLTVGYRAVDVLGTADTAKLSVDAVGSSVVASGATAPTVTRSILTVGSGVEKISLAAANTNYANVVGTSTVNTLTVTGAGTNDILVGTLKAVSTIDASAATGANTFDVQSALSTGDVVTGGSGADTLAFTAANAATVTVSGVETLRVDGGTAITTFSANPAFTSLDIRSTAATTLAGVSTLSNINYNGTQLTGYAGTSGNLTLNTAFAGTADAVAINVGNRGVASTGSYNIGTLGASGIEGLTITQADMLATATTTATINNTGLKTLAATTAGNLALTLSTKADSAPLFSGTTASTTGSNTVTSIDLSGVAGTANMTFEAGTFAAAASVKSAVGGSTFTAGAETASDAITFTGGAGVDSFTTGTAGTYVADLAGGATNVFNAGSLAAAASGNTATVTGGDGADTITGGANADTITGGAGNDNITGGKGADTLNGGVGADTYNFKLGAGITAATPEVQNILVATNGTANVASKYLINILGTTVEFTTDATPTGAEFVTGMVSALNAVAAGRYTAAAGAGTSIDVTFANAQGNAAASTVQVYNSSTAAAATATLTNGLDLTVSTTTPGVAEVAAQTADSTLSLSDLLTFVSSSDVINVTTQAGVDVTLLAASTTAASAGNYGAVSATGLYTLDATRDTTLALTVDSIAANITAGAGGSVAGESVLFAFNGQAYIYVSDGTAGYATGDLVITLVGKTTATTGLTFGTGDIITAV